MSVKLMSYAFDTHLNGNDKLVLLALCDFASDDGDSCYPSIQRIADKASISERTAQRILSKFREWGLITPIKNMQGGFGKTVHYVINVAMLQKGDKMTPFQMDEKGDSGDVKRVTNEAEKGDIAVSPDPSENHQRTISSVVAREGAPSQPDDKNHEKALQDGSFTLQPPAPDPKAKPKKPKTPILTPLDPEFRPDEMWIRYAQSRKLSMPEIKEEWNKFRDHHVAKASRFADWFAAWRNWIRRSCDIRANQSRRFN